MGGEVLVVGILFGILCTSSAGIGYCMFWCVWRKENPALETTGHYGSNLLSPFP